MNDYGNAENEVMRRLREMFDLPQEQPPQRRELNPVSDIALRTGMSDENAMRWVCQVARHILDTDKAGGCVEFVAADGKRRKLKVPRI